MRKIHKTVLQRSIPSKFFFEGTRRGEDVGYMTISPCGCGTPPHSLASPSTDSIPLDLFAFAAVAHLFFRPHIPSVFFLFLLLLLLLLLLLRLVITSKPKQHQEHHQPEDHQDQLQAHSSQSWAACRCCYYNDIVGACVPFTLAVRSLSATASIWAAVFLLSLFFSL